MNRRPFVLTVIFSLLLLLLLQACVTASRGSCRARMGALQADLVGRDTSHLIINSDFAYEEVPVSTGEVLPSIDTPNMSVTVNGTVVEFVGHRQPSEQSLAHWLDRESVLFTILRPNRPPDQPLYIFATATTKLSMIRYVIETLEPSAVMRLAVRPSAPERSPFRPSAALSHLFAEATRENRPGESTFADHGRAVELLVRATEGCAEARAIAEPEGLNGYDRLMLVGKAFAQCGCGGDPDSLVALYWSMAFHGSRPARWLPWDPSVADSLAPDATYEDLVRATAATRPLRPSP